MIFDRGLTRRLVAFFVLMLPTTCGATDPLKLWDNRCDDCHGRADQFSQKYLWNVGGQLQGRHHIDDLHLFMQNHYIPAHQVDSIKRLLLSHANSPLRFETECGSCHGEIGSFIEQSIWVRGDSMTAMKAGMEVSEFLATHEGLQPEDIEFFLKLITRVGR